MTPALDRVVKRDRFYPPRDRRGEEIPHHLESIGALRAVPWMLRFFDRRVPDEFWTETSDLQTKEPTIVVSCPCGEEPTLYFRLRSFSIAECPCGRFFLHRVGDDGQQVLVGHDPEKLPRPDPEPAPDPEPEEDPDPAALAPIDAP